MEFSREKTFREGISQISIPLSLDNLRLVRFHNWELVGFMFNYWLIFLQRDCLVLCSVGQRPIWFWFQGQSVFFGSGFMSGCVPFVLLSGLGCVSFTKSVLYPRLLPSLMNYVLPIYSEILSFSTYHIYP